MSLKARLRRLENIISSDEQGIMSEKKQIEMFGCTFKDMSTEKRQAILEALEQRMKELGMNF